MSELPPCTQNQKLKEQNYQVYMIFCAQFMVVKLNCLWYLASLTIRGYAFL